EARLRSGRHQASSQGDRRRRDLRALLLVRADVAREPRLLRGRPRLADDDGREDAHRRGDAHQSVGRRHVHQSHRRERHVALRRGRAPGPRDGRRASSRGGEDGPRTRLRWRIAVLRHVGGQLGTTLRVNIMATYNIADLYEALADAIPDNPALVAGEARYTFAELDRRANQLAHALAKRGVGKGSHVGLHMYNHATYPETMLACMKLRAVPININYRYVADELRYMIDDAELVAIVSHGIYAGLVDEANYEGSTLKSFIVVRDGFDGELPAHWEDYEAILKGQSDARDFGPRSNDDLFIVYTGGTTGMPKGVMWRHEDLFFAALQGGSPGGEPVESVEQLVEQAVEGWYARTMLPCAPFIHGSAQLTSWICTLTGAKVVIQTGRSFDPKRILELIEQEQVGTI